MVLVRLFIASAWWSNRLSPPSHFPIAKPFGLLFFLVYTFLCYRYRSGISHRTFIALSIFFLGFIGHTGSCISFPRYCLCIITLLYILPSKLQSSFLRYCIASYSNLVQCTLLPPRIVHTSVFTLLQSLFFITHAYIHLCL